MSGRQRRGPLSPDDEDLWTHVKRSVHPLRRGPRARVIDGAATPMSDPPPELPAAAPHAMPELSRLAAPSAGRPGWQPLVPQLATPRPKPAPQAPAPFDKRQARKIATGKVDIEGRLDLHGLRENEAIVRLRGFLRQAQAQGKRTVLVITGKGRDSDDDPSAPFDFGHDRSPRGVLKRNVPRWLAGPDIAPLVVSFTTAHTRHGGEGALYVHLRRA
jgi:DNA-nicking Smr family endonuclease